MRMHDDVHVPWGNAPGAEPGSQHRRSVPGYVQASCLARGLVRAGIDQDCVVAVRGDVAVTGRVDPISVTGTGQVDVHRDAGNHSDLDYADRPGHWFSGP